MEIVASDLCRAHSAYELSAGRFVPSTESPDRADAIAETLKAEGFRFKAPNATPSDSILHRVHTREYTDFLASAWPRWEERFGAETPAIGFAWPSRGIQPVRPDDLVGQLGYHAFSADCSIVAGTWQAAITSAAIAEAAARLVADGASASYALCRPPGHHATKDQFGGYCFLNNCAIAAETLRESGHRRVAVLDVDYHHGNGTQEIFYERSDVLTVSVHADPVFEYPWFIGYASETGRGEGEGWNLNVPLPRGTRIDDWLEALSTGIDRIETADVGALVVALGVDTFQEDPLGSFALVTADYAEIAERIADLNLPTVVVQEGGYNVEQIGKNVAAFLTAFARHVS